ncbi:DUF3592 domain-containing protein [Streptomyces sp. NPDC002476]|uniref:DUF3592 domain-containing protein n=1 Tax=Streptomyces sp. NPDC002476 TaxID=3364648 RepID=UPI003674DEE9
MAAVYFIVSVSAATVMGTLLDRQLQGPRLRAAWAAGLTSDARCTRVRTEEGTDPEGVPMVRTHPTLEFRTSDGRTVTFEERRERTEVAVGDVVTVYYSAQDPQAATIRPPSLFMLHTRAVIIGMGTVVAAVTATVLALVP